MTRWLTWVLVWAAMLVGRDATAQPRAVVDALDVEGNLRVEDEAVLRAAGIEPGDPLTPRMLGDAIRRVYALELFEDIVIDARAVGDVITLVFVVSEKPAIESVSYEGNRAIDDDELEEELALRAGSVLDENAIEDGARRIEELYREKGFYLVEVSWALQPAAPGSVDVVYTVREEARVRVERVSFVGNVDLDDRQLGRSIFTRPGSLLSFLTQQGRFKEDEFENDLQRLRFAYYEEGYLDVVVGDPAVELTRDRAGIVVSIPIAEGDQYTVSDVSVSGDMLVSQEELMSEYVRTEPGAIFRSSSVRGDIERLTEVYRDAGYANVNVNMLTRQDPVGDTVGLQYDIDQGELCYIGRIEFAGNSLTRDRVIRRELLIEEGDQYSGTDLDRSLAYVRRLGYFEDVQLREEPRRDNPRIIDLVIEVTERPTRSLQVGAGFSSADSFIATAEVRENNLFGRGQSLTLNAQVSALRTIFVLSFIEPYLANTRVLLSLDLFRREEILPSFERQSAGFGLGFGYRPFRRHDFWRDLQFTWGYQLENVSITSGGSTTSLSGAARRSTGGLTSGANVGMSLDRRDDRLVTTRGSYQSVNLEVSDSIFGSENEFYRVRAASRWYATPSFIDCGDGEASENRFRRRSVSRGVCRWLSSWVAKVNVELGVVGTTNPLKDVPIFERFFVGGPTTVRGFERFSLSPTQPGASRTSPEMSLRDELVGGHRQLLMNVELEFPLVQMLGLRGVVFFDAGNAFDATEPFTLAMDLWDGPDGNVLRTAVGWGFRWRSPIGPLRFEWGYPLVRDQGERRAVFEFSIQNSF